jgi:tRNA(His) 5'-end guanylyltransferase
MNTKTSLINQYIYEFSALEEEALARPVAKECEFLLFRMDGVDASKKYLKSSITNKTYTAAQNRSLVDTYYRYRNNIHPERRNYFLFALAISDEVSFALNIGDNNQGKRVFKIGSHLSTSLASSMTINHEFTHKMFYSNKKRIKNNEKPVPPRAMQYDARPLICDDLEQIKQYIEYRWWLGYRNAMCKVLRIESDLSDEDIYETSLKNDVEALEDNINHRNLMPIVMKAISEFSIYIPDANGKFNATPLDSEAELIRAIGAVEAFFYHCNPLLANQVS